MLKLELKRILKTRSTWYLCALALVIYLSFLLLSLLTHYYDYVDDNGQEQTLRGLKAVEADRERFAQIEGELTSERIRQETQKVNDALGSDDPRAYSDIVRPRTPIMLPVAFAFTDPQNGNIPLYAISADEAAGYYEKRVDYLRWNLELQYPDRPEITEYVLSKNAEIETPFRYSYGTGSDRNIFSFFNMCTAVLAIICTVIFAPMFSSDYSTGSDDILRCTLRGRTPLGLSRMLTALILSTAIYMVCAAAYLGVIYWIFGTDSSSYQLTYGFLGFLDMTSAGFEFYVILSGFISFIATICLTLLLSAKIKSPTITLAAAIAMILIPSILGRIAGEGNIGNWIRRLLPSCGVGLSRSMHFELMRLDFLWIGSINIWAPYVMMIAPLVEIPILFGLAARSYNRHELA